MKTSWLAAAGVTLALVLWMGSGWLFPADDPVDGSAENSGGEPLPAGTRDGPDATVPIHVQVMRTELEPQTRHVVLRGQLEPLRLLSLRAETAGRVQALPVERGTRVRAGDTIARLDPGTRPAELLQAEAAVASAQAEQAAAASLTERGLQSSLQALQASAALQRARAERDRIQLDLQYTHIKAPFSGVIEVLPVEIGQLVERGEPIATLLDDSALDVTARVPQQSAAELVAGQPVQVELITGQTLTGELRWVASMADPGTRSFAISARVANPGRALAAGTSATLKIPIEQVPALFVSPSILALGEDGTLGVKLVDNEERIVFQPVSLLSTSLDGAWVTGVPAKARLVTLGQGFVSAGERVVATEPDSEGADPVSIDPESAEPGTGPARRPGDDGRAATHAATGDRS